MDIIEQLEHQLPIIGLDTNRIVIETSGVFDGSFTVFNTGGGTLAGTISCNEQSISFTPASFSGNRVRIVYKFALSSYAQGTVINTEAVLISNGGERVVPIVIKVVPHAFVTTDGSKLTSLREFYQYAKKNATQAGNIVYSQTFKSWLLDINYEYIDIYETIIKDTNKERALENFFLLNKLKKPANITVSTNAIKHEIFYNSKDILSSSFYVTKHGFGYFSSDIYVENKSNWLIVSKNAITSSDFKKSETEDTRPVETAAVNYYINTALVKDKNVSDKIFIGDNVEVTVSVRRKAPLNVSLSKEAFSYDDSGSLVIVNNCGKDIALDVSVKDSYIKFEGKRYFAEDKTEIPFRVKLSGLQLTQVAILKQAYIVTEIYLKATVDDAVFKKTIKVVIGNMY